MKRNEHKNKVLPEQPLPRGFPIRLITPFLSAVLESEPQVVFAVNRGEVHKAAEEPLVKLDDKPVLPFEVGNEEIEFLPRAFLSDVWAVTSSSHTFALSNRSTRAS